MSKKIANLQKIRQAKRQKTGWTAAEIKKRAAQERAAFKKLTENEPDALASGGDMANILEEKNDDEEDQPSATGP